MQPTDSAPETDRREGGPQAALIAVALLAVGVVIAFVMHQGWTPHIWPYLRLALSLLVGGGALSLGVVIVRGFWRKRADADLGRLAVSLVLLLSVLFAAGAFIAVLYGLGHARLLVAILAITGFVTHAIKAVQIRRAGGILRSLIAPLSLCGLMLGILLNNGQAFGLKASGATNLATALLFGVSGLGLAFSGFSAEKSKDDAS